MTPTLPPAAPVRPPAAISLTSLARAVRRYSLLFALFVLLASGVAAAVWFFLPLPNLTGHVTYRIAAIPPSVLDAGASKPMDFTLYKQMQMALLKNRVVLNAAIADPAVAGVKMLDPAKVPDPIAWLSKNLIVDFPLGTEYMRVGLEGNEPEEVLAIIKAVGDAYLKETLTNDRGMKYRLLENWEKAQASYSAKLAENYTMMQRIMSQLGSGDAETMAYRERSLEQQINSAQGELIKLSQQVRMATLAETTSKSQLDNPPPTIPDEQLNEVLQRHPDYVNLQQEIQAIEQFIVEKRKILAAGVTTALVQQAEERLVKAKEELAALPGTLKPKLLEQYQKEVRLVAQQQLNLSRARNAQLSAQRDEMMKFIEEQLKKQGEMNVRQSDMVKLRNDIKTAVEQEKTVSELIDKLRPEVQADPRVTVWESANVTLGVEGSRRTKYTMMAFFGTLVLGLALVQGLEYRNRRVLNADELSGGLGLAVLGTVPFIPQSSAGEDQAVWTHMLAEAVNTTRTMLLAPRSHGEAGMMRTVLITSATSGEGKTSLATHLAVSLAGAGRRVLLIDADMRRPAAHLVFGMEPRPGLSDYLLGTKPADLVVQNCRVDGLHVIPAGRWHAAAAAALSTDRWQALILDSAGRYDFVLVDSPPVLPVSDALAIARTVDGVVVAVMREHSRYLAVQAATNRLQMVGARILGVVFSGTKAGRDYHYDRYYYQATADVESDATVDAGQT